MDICDVILSDHQEQRALFEVSIPFFPLAAPAEAN